MSQSKFSGSRKFTLRFQYFEITGIEKYKKKHIEEICSKTMFLEIKEVGGYFEISVF